MALLMKHDPAALDTALAAAVGDDPMLVAELRSIFLASARGHADALDRAMSAADWRDAALRLHGLAASFGAIELMVLADHASSASACDSALLAEIHGAIGDLTV